VILLTDMWFSFFCYFRWPVEALKRSVRITKAVARII